VSSNPVRGEVYSIQHYVMKFVHDLQQVGGFLRVLRFPQPIKLALVFFSSLVIYVMNQYYYKFLLKTIVFSCKFPGHKVSFARYMVFYVVSVICSSSQSLEICQPLVPLDSSGFCNTKYNHFPFNDIICFFNKINNTFKAFNN
jgi:hypothetical protein